MFMACEGDEVTISGCNDNGGSCTGNQYISLVAASNEKTTLAENDDYCGLCSQITYVVPTQLPGEKPKCTKYIVQEGCAADQICSGTIAISLNVITPTMHPTEHPLSLLEMSEEEEISGSRRLKSDLLITVNGTSDNYYYYET